MADEEKMKPTTEGRKRPPVNVQGDVTLDPEQAVFRGGLGAISPDDLIMRALMRGGMRPGLVGSPFFKRLIGQMQAFAALSDIANLQLEGPTTADLINTGGILGAFDRGGVRDLASRLVGLMGAPNLEAVASIARGRTPEEVATLVGQDEGVTDEDRAQLEAATGSVGGFPGLGEALFANVLASPSVAQLLGSLLSFGRPGFGGILQNYIQDILYPTYRAFEPELGLQTDPLTLLAQRLGLGGR